MMPPCGYKFDGQVCDAVGDHRCTLRGDHVVAFFAELLVHTKGRYAGQPFILADWQERDIVRPLLDTVRYTEESEVCGQYVRQYEICWIEIARKLERQNGTTRRSNALPIDR